VPAASQGREKDVVIFSCVRTAGVHHRSIGFVADERRINVGITRARCALLIIGHAASLAVDERWRNLVKSAVERNVMFQPEKPYNDYMEQVRAYACARSCALVYASSAYNDLHLRTTTSGAG
jgi:senataxin